MKFCNTQLIFLKNFNIQLIQSLLNKERKNMQKSNFMCLIFVVVLSFSVFCQVTYCADTILTSDDLPSLGESLVITSDTRVIVKEGETALVQGVLSVNGTKNSNVKFEIENFGDLTIDNASIMCSYGNFTIENRGYGVLTVQKSQFTLIDNSTLNIGNLADCSMDGVSLEVLGGFLYLQNTGSLTIENGYFKDQYDGTFIFNYAEASLSDCTYVVNGAEGKIEIFNSGDLQLQQNSFDVDYGGKLNLNTLTGTLTVDDFNIDVSGSSHGKKSDVNLLMGNSTWDSCTFTNNGGTINCLNTGEVIANDWSVSSPSVDSSTILSNSGSMAFKNLQLSDAGSTSITNFEFMSLNDCSFTSSGQLNFMNNGNLTVKDWLVKTTAEDATGLVYNEGDLTFNAPFIENVEGDVLEAVGNEGQEFVESSGGKITVTNKGLMTRHDIINGDSDSSMLAILAVVAVVVVAGVVFYLMKKKKTL